MWKQDGRMRPEQKSGRLLALWQHAGRINRDHVDIIFAAHARIIDRRFEPKKQVCDNTVLYFVVDIDPRNIERAPVMEIHDVFGIAKLKEGLGQIGTLSDIQPVRCTTVCQVTKTAGFSFRPTVSGLRSRKLEKRPLSLRTDFGSCGGPCG